MSNNPPNPDPNRGRWIKGPQSALTDFLASQNISAARIRAEADARRAAARANTASNGNTASNQSQSQNNREQDDEAGDDDVATTTTRAQKRQREKAAIAEIKKSRAYKRMKRNGPPDAPDIPDELALALFEGSTPLPGQMSNCEICDKRFTVTPYSRAGPLGGLLCPPCGKNLAKGEDANKKLKKKGNMSRRKIQSRILDGTYSLGAKSLMTLCIETLAKHIDLAEDLGDLPPPIVDRIARLLSKQRLLDSRTLGLFLQSQHEAINVYDAAKLLSDDFLQIFRLMPHLKRLKVRNAIQFTDPVMQFLVTRNISLESIYIHGANLLSDDLWTEFLTKKGANLKELQIQYTDKHVGDTLVGLLSTVCPDLGRLKICHNQQVSDEGIQHIADLKKLEHLSLHCIKPTKTDSYLHVVQKIGQQLRTFSIRKVSHVDDRLLDALHENCTSLSKLRITESEFMTDAGFVRLFRDWKNKPLSFLDLQKCRYVDAAKPRDNEHKVGLCSEGFAALMEHSGSGLRYLNVHACRNISRQAFEKVFAIDKVYSQLSYLEISFCEEVNDFIVGSIFRSCPNLKELNIFGCMKVKDVRVPRGKILVGVPNALGMRIEGVDD